MTAPPCQMLRTVILGGGPGGIALLLASRHGSGLPDLMQGGFAIVERGPALGAGSIGANVISSDSAAETFLDCLAGDTHPALAVLRECPQARAVRRYAGGAVPLPLVGALLTRIGATLDAAVREAGGHVLTRHAALNLRRRQDGTWAIGIRHTLTGRRAVLHARNVVLSLGAAQPEARLTQQSVGGAPLLPRHAAKLMQSGTAFTSVGMAEIARQLRGRAQPVVAVVGGSTSAVAAANLLLIRLPDTGFTQGGVVLMHRRPLRAFYESASAAHADGYDDFGPADICPVTGRVFRLAGLRFQQRELVLRAQGIGGRTPDPRLVLHPLDRMPAAATQDCLDRADLVIAAIGYRPRTLPVFGANGARIRLRGDSTQMLPLVDDRCRVVDADGAPLRGLFALGLAHGFVPSGRFGGEPSFVGQANGLWLWQNDVGRLILAQLSDAAAPSPGLAIPDWAAAQPAVARRA